MTEELGACARLKYLLELALERYVNREEYN